jgi:DNA-binding transcriptional regulator YiaG
MAMSAQTTDPASVSLVEEIRNRRPVPPPRRLRAMRERVGVTQHRLATELGVHPVTVARWEAGTRSPSGSLRDRYLDLLEALAEVAA